MQGIDTADPYLATELIGFSAGLVITLLLLILTLRAAKFPGSSFANIPLACCSFLWNLAGLVHVVLPLWKSNHVHATLVASGIQFTAAAIWPIPMLAIWFPFAQFYWQKIGLWILQTFAFTNAIVVIALLWLAAFGVEVLPHNFVAELPSFGGLAVAMAGACILLAGRSGPQILRISLSTAFLGVLGTTLTILVNRILPFGREWNAALNAVGKQSALLIVLGAFFVFPHFRFADLFIRYSLKILTASLLAVIFVFFLENAFVWRLANRTALAGTMHVLSSSIFVTFLLLLFAWLNSKIDTFVNRKLLGSEDSDDLWEELDTKLQQLHSEKEVIAATEEIIQRALNVEKVYTLPSQKFSSCLLFTGMRRGEIVEVGRKSPLRALLSLPDLQILVPVLTPEEITCVLAISQISSRRNLVSFEIDRLRGAAFRLGNRLGSLRMERAMSEQQSREVLLRQQAAEAELRALRAQINPHFLFNSLNSLANLIMANPNRAEIMTLRLARVFRYVLAHTAQSLSSIQDEMSFLQTYLQIEEARFGDRLVTEFSVAAETATVLIPSLILQPIVENALKHGLAPKRGQGHLWISVYPKGDRVCLCVEDDGLGLGGFRLDYGDIGQMSQEEYSGQKKITGLGLANVARRLATYYRDCACISIQNREAGGTCVSLLIPRENGAD